MKKILIAGSGGFAKEVLCIIKDCGLMTSFLGFIEPDSIIKKGNIPSEVLGFPVFPYSFVDTNIHSVSIGIGESKIREKILTELPNDTEYISLIHPNVVISDWVNIGKGAIICAGCILTSDITIGDFVQLNLNTTIGHDCEIENFFTTAPNVNISGNCRIGEHVYFGTASCTKQGLTINSNITIGMGSVVTKNLTDEGIYVGIPAKKLIK